jgi:sensor histidine kinase regulating citrate/malate metabolism
MAKLIFLGGLIFKGGNLMQFTWFLILIVLTGYIYKLISYHRTQTENCKHSSKLLNDIRIHRHNFSHHVQTVYGLLEIGEFSEAHEYLKEQFGLLVIHEELTKLSNPSIQALLLTKIALAEVKNIKLEILVNTELTSLTLPVSQVNIILGNIIDNAIEAATYLNKEERFVYLNIKDSLERYHFTVTNYGPPIDKKIINRIFDLGFTTKNSGKGLGLYSVKYCTDKCKGKIVVCSDKKRGTIFQVFLPKRGTIKISDH